MVQNHNFFSSAFLQFGLGCSMSYLVLVAVCCRLCLFSQASLLVPLVHFLVCLEACYQSLLLIGPYMQIRYIGLLYIKECLVNIFCSEEFYYMWPYHLTLLDFYVQLAALLTLILIIILNLAVGILPHVDNFAHIGGFLSGFLLGFVFLIRPQFGWINQKPCPPGYIAPPVKSKHKTYQYVLWVVSLILLIIG